MPPFRRRLWSTPRPPGSSRGSSASLEPFEPSPHRSSRVPRCDAPGPAHCQVHARPGEGLPQGLGCALPREPAEVNSAQGRPRRLLPCPPQRGLRKGLPGARTTPRCDIPAAPASFYFPGEIPICNGLGFLEDGAGSRGGPARGAAASPAAERLAGAGRRSDPGRRASGGGQSRARGRESGPECGMVVGLLRHRWCCRGLADARALPDLRGASCGDDGVLLDVEG